MTSSYLLVLLQEPPGLYIPHIVNSYGTTRYLVYTMRRLIDNEPNIRVKPMRILGVGMARTGTNCTV